MTSNELFNPLKICLGKTIDLYGRYNLNPIPYIPIQTPSVILLEDMQKYGLVEFDTATTFCITALAKTIIENRKAHTKSYEEAMRKAVLLPMVMNRLAEKHKENTKPVIKRSLTMTEKFPPETSERRMANIYLGNIQFLKSLDIVLFTRVPKNLKVNNETRIFADSAGTISLTFDTAYSKSDLIALVLRTIEQLY
jgi:hypothetical protein